MHVRNKKQNCRKRIYFRLYGEITLNLNFYKKLTRFFSFYYVYLPEKSSWGVSGTGARAGTVADGTRIWAQPTSGTRAGLEFGDTGPWSTISLMWPKGSTWVSRSNSTPSPAPSRTGISRISGSTIADFC